MGFGFTNALHNHRWAWGPSLSELDQILCIWGYGVGSGAPFCLDSVASYPLVLLETPSQSHHTCSQQSSERLGAMVWLCLSEVPPRNLTMWFSTLSTGKCLDNISNATVYLALHLEENTASHIKSDTEVNSDRLNMQVYKGSRKKRRDCMFKLRIGETFLS